MTVKTQLAVITTRYEGGDLRAEITRIMQEKRTGQLKINCLQGRVASLEWTEKKTYPDNSLDM